MHVYLGCPGLLRTPRPGHECGSPTPLVPAPPSPQAFVQFADPAAALPHPRRLRNLLTPLLPAALPHPRRLCSLPTPLLPRPPRPPSMAACLQAASCRSRRSPPRPLPCFEAGGGRRAVQGLHFVLVSSHGRLSVSIGGGGLIMVQGSNLALRMRLLEGRQGLGRSCAAPCAQAYCTRTHRNPTSSAACPCLALEPCRAVGVGRRPRRRLRGSHAPHRFCGVVGVGQA